MTTHIQTNWTPNPIHYATSATVTEIENCDPNITTSYGSKKLYCAGKMRGLPNFGYDAFHVTSAYFRAHGYEVRSPAEKDLSDGFDGNLDNFDMRKAMQWDLEAVLWADYIALLPGWQTSQGVAMEAAVARVTGKTPIIVVLVENVWGVDYTKMSTWEEIDRDYPDRIQLDLDKLLGISQKEHEEMLNNTDDIPEWISSSWSKNSNDILIPTILIDEPLKDSPNRIDESFKSSPLYEAYNLVHKDRGANYGPAFLDFSKQAKFAEVIFGVDKVEPEQIALFMLGVKISRLLQTPGHYDSLVDLGGYTETYQEVRKYRKEKEDADKLAQFLKNVEDDLGLDPKPFWTEKDVD